MMADQLTLAPKGTPKKTYRRLLLEDLPDLVGEGPDPSFIDSIETYGVLQPILVKATDKGYKILDGRRRVMALRLLEQKSVPAFVFRLSDWEGGGDVLTLVQNEQRSENIFVMLETIERLLERGASESEIYIATGILPARQRRVLRLRNLNPLLRLALSNGDIKASVAELAARLPEAYQQRLANILVEKGFLTASDVEDIRKIRTHTSQDSLPSSLFAGTQLSLNWKMAVESRLQEIISLVPEEDTFHSKIKELIENLQG